MFLRLGLKNPLHTLPPIWQSFSQIILMLELINHKAYSSVLQRMTDCQTDKVKKVNLMFYLVTRLRTPDTRKAITIFFLTTSPFLHLYVSMDFVSLTSHLPLSFFILDASPPGSLYYFSLCNKIFSLNVYPSDRLAPPSNFLFLSSFLLFFVIAKLF
jgi:hypothetical protein